MSRHPLQVVPLSEIAQLDFCFENFYAQEICALEREYEPANGRRINGFLYALSGEGEYTFSDQIIHLKPGSLIYLPKGSQHRFVCGEEEFSYIRIDFSMIDLKEKTEIIFSKAPLLVHAKTPFQLEALLKELTACHLFSSNQNRLKFISLLYELLYMLSMEMENPEKCKLQNRIAAGISYIDETYNKEFDIRQAASLCNLSVSRFRVLFREVTGMSVLEYRETLRMERARALLKTHSYLIKEIAEQLGYKDSYYFSHCFKKWFGVSPKNYIH